MRRHWRKARQRSESLAQFAAKTIESPALALNVRLSRDDDEVLGIDRSHAAVALHDSFTAGHLGRLDASAADVGLTVGEQDNLESGEAWWRYVCNAPFASPQIRTFVDLDI